MPAKDNASHSASPATGLRFAANLTTGLTVGLGAVLMTTALFAYLFVPILYDTQHLQDTMFFAELGWRVLQGAVPTVDFGHFYGGVIAQYVAWSFQLFGNTLKSIDYAFVLMLVTVSAFAAAVCAGRVGRLTGFGLALVLFACCLARVPLEELTAIQRPASAHSFVYNRFAIALSVVLLVYAMLKRRTDMAEVLVAGLCGVATYVVVLIKPTFVPMMPVFLLALAVGSRWISLLAALIGIALAILILDPWGLRVSNAFSYAVSAAGMRSSVSDLLLKSTAVFLVQPLSFLLALVAMGLVLRLGSGGAIRLTLIATVMSVGFAGMCATMGWRGSVGQQALPFLSVLALSIFEFWRRQTPADAVTGTVLRFISVSLIASFSLPHLAQTTLSGIVAAKRTPLLLKSEGPYASYLAWSDEFLTRNNRPVYDPMAQDEQLEFAKAHLLAGHPVNVGVEYVMIADGLDLLATVPDLGAYRLAGDYGVFPYLLQVPSVLEFPAWVNSTAPELAKDAPLPEAIDIMMIRRLNPTALSERLLGKMEGQFILCKQSELWNLHLRTDQVSSFCD